MNSNDQTAPVQNGTTKTKRTNKIVKTSFVDHLRTGSQTGLWCSLLIPVLLYSSIGDLGQVPPFKVATLVLSCYISAASVLECYHLVYGPRAKGDKTSLFRYLLRRIISDLFERPSSREVRESRSRSSGDHKDDEISEDLSITPPGWMPPSLAFVLFIPAGCTLKLSVWGLVCLLAYVKLLPGVFQRFPGSFSFGEGCLALQALTLFLFEAPSAILAFTDDPSTITGSFAFISKVGLCSCLLFCSLPLVPGCAWVARAPVFIPAGVVALLGVVLPFLLARLRRDPVTWVLGHIFDSPERTCLFGAWFACVLVAVAVVGAQPEKTRATTSARKYFHLLMVLIHTSGILLDPELIYLSSIVAMSVFILLEAMRTYKIQPFSKFLNDAFSIFLDEKDSGPLILTHIYLLVGCSLPLWITHDLESVSKIRLLSGVLSVGIGDSAASVIGSKFGRLRFPDSSKTVEGAAASAAAQLAFLWILVSADLILDPDWSKLCLAVCSVALLEAVTVQVDNLVLPAVMYVML